MRRSKVEVYLHVVWATYLRAELLTAVVEPQVHKVVWTEAEKLGCIVYALNGMADHVHLVVRISSRVSPADLAKQVKGVSSHFVNEHYPGEDHFRWQDGYGAFSISRNHLPRVVRYVQNQKAHHAAGKVWKEWEETDEEAEDPTARPEDGSH